MNKPLVVTFEREEAKALADWARMSGDLSENSEQIKTGVGKIDAALENHPSLLDIEGWRPICEAPTDGTPVYIMHERKSWVYLARYKEPRLDSPNPTYKWFAIGASAQCFPTHFIMPGEQGSLEAALAAGQYTEMSHDV